MKVKLIRFKVFSVLLVIILLIGTMPVSISAVDTTSDFVYRMSDKVRIICYKGDSTTVIIPESIEGVIVSEIGRIEHFVSSSVEEIFIPRTISHYYIAGDLGPFCDNSQLKSIAVSEDNPYYSSIDGVMYNKEKTEIICYPVNKQEATYTIPKSVTLIYPCAHKQFAMGEEQETDINEIQKYPFFRNKYLKKLYVYDNSYGLDWAKNHNFPYEIISDEPQYIYGDANLDGEISVTDATAIQKLIIGLYVPEEQTELVNTLDDVNNDGVVSILDATCIQKYLVGNSGTYRTCELLEIKN